VVFVLSHRHYSPIEEEIARRKELASFSTLCARIFDFDQHQRNLTFVVLDAGGADTETSVCGGLMGGLAKNRGIRAMIIDGAGRDIDELRDINFPIWTRAITPRGTHTMFSGRKEELSINIPISCGGIIVNPGDFVVADEIGVTVIAAGEAAKLLAAAQEQAQREQATREWVAKGKTVEDC